LLVIQKIRSFVHFSQSLRLTNSTSFDNNLEARMSQIAEIDSSLTFFKCTHRFQADISDNFQGECKVVFGREFSPIPGTAFQIGIQAAGKLSCKIILKNCGQDQVNIRLFKVEVVDAVGEIRQVLLKSNLAPCSLVLLRPQDSVESESPYFRPWRLSKIARKEFTCFLEVEPCGGIKRYHCCLPSC
jgi:hypothetical protein